MEVKIILNPNAKMGVWTSALDVLINRICFCRETGAKLPGGV